MSDAPGTYSFNGRTFRHDEPISPPRMVVDGSVIVCTECDEVLLRDFQRMSPQEIAAAVAPHWHEKPEFAVGLHPRSRPD